MWRGVNAAGRLDPEGRATNSGRLDRNRRRFGRPGGRRRDGIRPVSSRPGEFPVCEDVADRSIALPFFPAMEPGQVERVKLALEAVLRGAH